MPVLQKFEIAKVLKLRQKNHRNKLWKGQVLLPSEHEISLILIKEKIKLIWTFRFFEIIIKIQMCTLFHFKKIKDARLLSNS